MTAVTPCILGLDLSLTRTGVALPDGSAFTLRPPKGSDRGMARLAWIRSRLVSPGRPSLDDNSALTPGVDVVAVEGYAYARANQAHQLGELGGVVRLALHQAGVRYVDVAPSVLKRYATGKGNAPKELVLVEAVKRLGYEGSDDNEADALWLRALAMDAYGHPVASVPQARRDASVKAITWPRIGRAAA